MEETLVFRMAAILKNGQGKKVAVMLYEKELARCIIYCFIKYYLKI